MSKIFDVFDSFDDAVVVSGKAGNVEFINSSAKKFFGKDSFQSVKEIFGEDVTNFSDECVFPIFQGVEMLTVKKSQWQEFIIFTFSPDSKIGRKIDILEKVGINLNDGLAAMSMAMKLLFSESPQDEKQKKYMSMMYHSYFKLRHLAGDVADMNGFIRGDKHLNVSAVDIVPMLSELVSSVKHFVEDMGIEIEFSSAVEAKIAFLDKDKAERMILTCIANSMRNIEKNGTISLRVSELKGKLIITILDDGMPMGEDALKSVFTPDGRGINISESGMGLGLVSYIAKLMSGSVMVGSSAGNGNTVKIILPTNVPHNILLRDSVSEYRSGNMDMIYTQLSDVLRYDKYSTLYMD